MWEGMADGAFEIVLFHDVHRPTGLRPERSSYQHGAPPEPWRLMFPDVPRPCLVTIIQEPTLARALGMGEPYDEPGDSEQFRRRFGRLCHVARIEGVGGSRASCWTRATLDVFCILYFMLEDPEKFWKGGRALSMRTGLHQSVCKAFAVVFTEPLPAEQVEPLLALCRGEQAARAG